VRRLVRPAVAYGAAVATGCIALACAAVAWGRLEEPAETMGWLPSLPSDAVLGIALPVVLIGSVMAVNWLIRLFTEKRSFSFDKSANVDFAQADTAPASRTRPEDPISR
jgi:hypothetical protein